MDTASAAAAWDALTSPHGKKPLLGAGLTHRARRRAEARQTVPSHPAAAMGNYLDAPVTDKQNEVFARGAGIAAPGADGENDEGPPDGIVAVASSMQGWRCEMEDRVTAHMDIPVRVLISLGTLRENVGRY